jgi:5,10-methylene-tetrahydrofolate dehydrogenase/methenyl tetrahydrofolate cyclohydrolase
MPQAILLASRGADATVTIGHSRTEDMKSQCQQADIVVAAVGRPNMVKKSWIKPGAIVVDVGINRVDDEESPRGYVLVGDVEKSANEVASWMTPVPGGVGPMTVAMLMENTVVAAENKIE